MCGSLNVLLHEKTKNKKKQWIWKKKPTTYLYENLLKQRYSPSLSVYWMRWLDSEVYNCFHCFNPVPPNNQIGASELRTCSHHPNYKIDGGNEDCHLMSTVSLAAAKQCWCSPHIFKIWQILKDTFIYFALLLTESICDVLICYSLRIHTHVGHNSVLNHRYKFSHCNFSSNHGQGSGYHGGQRLNARPGPSHFGVYCPLLNPDSLNVVTLNKIWW